MGIVADEREWCPFVGYHFCSLNEEMVEKGFTADEEHEADIDGQAATHYGSGKKCCDVVASILGKGQYHHECRDEYQRQDYLTFLKALTYHPPNPYSPHFASSSTNFWAMTALESFCVIFGIATLCALHFSRSSEVLRAQQSTPGSTG